MLHRSEPSLRIMLSRYRIELWKYTKITLPDSRRLGGILRTELVPQMISSNSFVTEVGHL